MNTDEMTEIEYQQKRVTKADRKARKLAKKLARRAAINGDDPERAEREAAKRLRRLERQQKRAIQGLNHAAIYSLRD